MASTTSTHKSLKGKSRGEMKNDTKVFLLSILVMKLVSPQAKQMGIQSFTFTPSVVIRILEVPDYGHSTCVEKEKFSIGHKWYFLA